MSAEQRLLCQDILERVERIESTIANGCEAFEQSHVLRDAVILNFIVIGKAAKNLDVTLTQRHPHIQWKSVAGFRDILVHQYRKTRLELDWWSAQKDLPALKAAMLRDIRRGALLQIPPVPVIAE